MPSDKVQNYLPMRKPMPTHAAANILSAPLPLNSFQRALDQEEDQRQQQAISSLELDTADSDLSRSADISIEQQYYSPSIPIISLCTSENPSVTLPTTTRLSAASNSSALRIVSKCKEGTVMKGLNIFAGKPDVVAKADEAYPAWLWGLLDKSEKKNAADPPLEEQLRPEYIRLLNRRKIAAAALARKK
ncbi:hypothetical protein HDU67_004406 [Dinochytrium kinnereticum]|nr:hypothetical protein HDU67_004406 [Dinochytrium kinnereticum]